MLTPDRKYSFVTKISSCLQAIDFLSNELPNLYEKYGLMEKEEIEKLGFTDDISWESEEAEKKFLFDKIGSLKKKAYESARSQAEAKFKGKAEKSE